MLFNILATYFLSPLQTKMTKIVLLATRKNNNILYLNQWKTNVSIDLFGRWLSVVGSVKCESLWWSLGIFRIGNGTSCSPTVKLYHIFTLQTFLSVIHRTTTNNYFHCFRHSLHLLSAKLTKLSHKEIVYCVPINHMYCHFISHTYFCNDYSLVFWAAWTASSICLKAIISFNLVKRLQTNSRNGICTLFHSKVKIMTTQKIYLPEKQVPSESFISL